MTNYMMERKKRLDAEQVRDYAIFAQLGGTIFCTLGFIKWLTEYRAVPATLLAVFGIYLVVSGLLIPQSIGWFYKSFSFVGNKIGNIIFEVLLSVVYLAFLIPVSLFVKRKKNRYLYFSWEQEYLGEENVGFLLWKGTGIEDRKGMAGTTIKLIGVLIGNGQYIFLPIVVLLIVLGIILFFVSSSVVAPFIYTLF